MPFNVLLLPLLGGYIFISCWNRTRFQVKRHSNQRLLFDSAIAGVLLLVAAFISAKAMGRLLPECRDFWHSRVPFGYAGTSLLALGYGAALWLPLNVYPSRKKAEAKRAITKSNDYLELLLYRAVVETKMVSLSLKTGKVYVGMIIRNFDPAYERKYVSILPMKSGFRREDLTVQFTTDYARVYQQVVDESVTLGVDLDDFQVVIPVMEIQSASFFDPTAYRLFSAV